MVKRTLPPTVDGVVEAVPSLRDFAARLEEHGEAFMRMFDEPRAAAVRVPIKRPETIVPAPEVAKRLEASSVPRDELAEVWSGGKQNRKRSRQDFSQLPRPPPQTGNSTPPAALSAKAERRRFMSGKAADVHRPATLQAQPQKRRRVPCQPGGLGLTREDFLNMQREVQTFGAEALDKKQRKQFEAWQLHNVKAAPQKPGRVSAAIGKGIAKKQAESEQKAKEEAIASGMLSVKGSGKHKNRNNVDKGLVEDGGLFKAGILRVKSTALGKSTSSKRKGPLSQRRAFSSGRIGNLDGNSQKAWNVASAQQTKKKGPSKKGRK